MIRFVFIFFFLISTRGICQSQIHVRLSNSPGNIAPGGHATLFFEVTSDTLLPDAIQESITLPEKWQLLSKRRPEKTAGQKETRFFYVFGTPADCASGDFHVNFILKNGQQEIPTPVTVRVEEVRKVNIHIVSNPESIKEGDTLRVDYLIENSGNKTETIALETNHGKVESYTDSISLAPNARLNVTVSQIIPVSTNNAWEVSSDLAANMNGVAPVFQTISIPVFSSKVKKTDPYFRFPIEVGGGYLTYSYGNRRMSAFQYSATGRGYADQKEKHFIDFTIRGPNQFVFPAIGSYDQYSLEYRYKGRTFVSIGDYALQLTNLIEYGRFGRGAKLEQQFKKVGYTLFFQKARFYPSQKESFGGRFIYKLNERSDIGITYASKNVRYHDRLFWSNLIGLSANIRTKDIQVESEISTGTAQGKTDYGAFLRMQMTRKWFTLAGNIVYAGKNFYGFYNNSRLINSNIGINLSKKLTLGVSGNFSNVNPSLDATFYSMSPKERGYMTYLSYQINMQNRVFAFFAQQSRKDRQLPADFDYTEEFGNLAYHYTGQKFTLFYQGRYGHAQNHLVSDNAGKKQSFSNLVQPAFRVFPWMWLGGYFEHQHTSKFSSSDLVQDLFFYGGNTRINIKRNLMANLMYRNNYAPDELYVRRSYVDVSVLLDLTRHRFSLTGGRSFVPNIQNHNENTLFITLKYALKLNVPLSRRRNLGSVKGKLTGIGFSKKGTMIQLGSHKFLTDSSGAFSFNSVQPDRYYLSVIQNESRNDGVIPNVKVPMLIDVKADSLNVIEIPFTRTGGITGKVEFLKNNQNGLSSILNEKPVVLIKLSNEKTRYLTEVNEKGEFSFKEMTPGTWNITALIPGNQDRLLIEDSARQLEIEIDQTKDIVFKIRPNEKRIHFSEKSFEVSVKK